MKLIPNAVTRNFGRQVLTLQKHSPRLLFVAGIAGVVGSTVLACRATLHINAIVDDVESEVNGLKENMRGNYSETEYRKDLAYVYVKGGVRTAKLYAPAVILGGLSIGALTGSHITLSRRNAGLTAAYAAVSKAYDDYRDRVKQEYGPERELDIYHAVSMEKLIGEDGTAELVKTANPRKMSPYAKFFDEGSPNWQKNAELNKLFIQCQQDYANHRLHAYGHVFLNEVYDSLGVDRTQAGSVVGWLRGKGGDDYIDFGIFEAANSEFVNGWERNILLDFNVDGVIWDQI